MSKPTIRIAIASDIVCPWCYIGKRRLEKAMQLASDKYDFEVEYLPFELNPQLPANGVNNKEYLEQKFGGEDRYNELTGNVTRIAAQEGLRFDFAIQQVSPNTRNAHRVIQLAREDGKQSDLIEALYKAYFTDGIDLSQKENLIDIAAAAGMDREKVSLFLDSNTGTVEVEMAERELHQLGITGVPFFIIDNKYGVSGAQRPETFLRVFDEIGAATVDDGESCDVDEKNC